MTDAGRTIVHTGDGKGKTTAALGLALRAVGQGQRVLIVQFLKGDWPTGELRAAERLAPELTIVPMGKGFTWQHESLEIDRAAAAEAWAFARDSLLSGEYGLVILDEINYAIDYGFLDPDVVVAVLQARPAGVHVVLTGRAAHPKVIALADTVTEMRAVKHAYGAPGARAVRGIEF